MNIKENNNYVDNRGKISMILENCKIGSISRIETEPNNKRAGHYHKSDGHWIIINEGQIIIYERPTGSFQIPKRIVLNKGDIHWTGPMTDHLMVAKVYTVFDCYSTLPRDQSNYENETVRITEDLEKIYQEFYNGYIENN